ncbi:MAG: hypothetical protein A2148_12330 [Chloroflexi bacterium RBG_16_68_14]|nr:MAG: hypothetical protein A2148_12330 [Chloroflexi bacterium RBG_16_68_14]
MVTTSTLATVKTETPPCALCPVDAPRTLGEIWMDGQMLGRMVQCQQCGLRYLSPRPSQMQRDWLYEQEYDVDLSGEHGETRFQSVQTDQDRALGRFRRYLGQLKTPQTGAGGRRPRLLDVGAGTGQLLALAQECGWDVSAIERSEDACRFLQKRFGSAAVVGCDLADVQGAAESYDAVIMAHVIEHLPDPLAALRRVQRLLSPGGRLLVATPNDASLYERIWQLRQRWRGGGVANPYVAIGWENGCWRRTPTRQDTRGLIEFQILTTEHVYFFTRTTLRRVLERAGFSGIRWAPGSVAPANSRLGRLLQSDPVNRLLFFLSRQAELMVVADRDEEKA